MSDTVSSDLFRAALVEGMASLRVQIELLAKSVSETRQDMKTELNALRNIDNRLGKIEVRIEDVAEVKIENAALRERVAMLEADRDRRNGQISLVGSLAKSPILAWIAAFGVAVVAWVKGVFTP